MEAQRMGKRTENIPENPEESNALLEFPNFNPYDSFLRNEDDPDTKRRKKEKSRKHKREKSKKSSKKERRHRRTSNSPSRKEADSDTMEEEISPWPVEWQRATKIQGRQYEDSNDSKRRTCAVEKWKSDGDKLGNSRQMSGKTARDDNSPTFSFWKDNESVMSEKEISPQPVDLSQSVDSNNTNLCFIHAQGSDTERHDSGRYTYHEKKGAASESVSTPYENESHSRDAGEQDRRPPDSASSNDQGFARSALMPVQSDSNRDIEPLSPLCQISPEQKSQIRHSSNSAVNMCNTSHSVCPQPEFASVSHQAGCSQNFYCTTDNNVTKYSGGEGGLPYKRYIGSRVALSHVGRYDVKDVSSERDYTPLTRDMSRDTSFKNSQGDDHAQVVATNMTSDPLNYGCDAPCSNYSNESQTAQHIKTISFHEPVAPTIYDYNSASRIFSKEPQTSGRGQTVASYLSETPLNLSITTDSRPKIVMHPSNQSEDAQGSIRRQHIASRQPSSSAEANQIGLSQNFCSGNMFCDIIIRSVPISFLNSVQATAQNQPQGHSSGSAAIHLESSEGLLKGSLTITINPASKLHGEKVPTTSGRDTMMCNPSNEETARIRRKRLLRYSSHQKPQKDNENLADDEMGDESSDDNQETTTK